MKDDLISRQAAIDAMMKLQTEDIEAYGASIPEGFDGDRAVAVLKALPSATDTNVGGNLIDRQAAISEIMEDNKDRSLHDDPATPEDYAEGYDEGIRNAAAIVLRMPSAQPEQRWIPCSTEMPPTGKDVLVTLEGGTVTDGERWEPQEGKWFLFGGGVNGLDEDVIAWMPLPNPYRPKGEEHG